MTETSDRVETDDRDIWHLVSVPNIVVDSKILMCCNKSSARGNRFVVAIEIDNKNFSMEIDTGASISAVNQNFYQKHFGKYTLKKDSLMLRSYNNSVFKPEGYFVVRVRYGDEEKLIKFYVVEDGAASILGRNWLDAFNVGFSMVNRLSVESRVDEVVKRFPEVFSSKIGCFRQAKISLHLKENVTPIFCKPRPIPVEEWPIDNDEIREQTRQDEELQEVMKYVKEGKWPEEKKENIRSYYNRRHELEVHNGILMTTAHCTTNETPAKLFLNRPVRTRLDLLRETRDEDENIEETYTPAQRHQQKVQDRQVKNYGGRRRRFEVGEKVMVTDYRTVNQRKWTPAEVIMKKGRNTYLCRIEEGKIWKRHTNQIIRRGTVEKGDTEIRITNRKTGVRSYATGAKQARTEEQRTLETRRNPEGTVDSPEESNVGQQDAATGEPETSVLEASAVEADKQERIQQDSRREELNDQGTQVHGNNTLEVTEATQTNSNKDVTPSAERVKVGKDCHSLGRTQEKCRPSRQCCDYKSEAPTDREAQAKKGGVK
ncbi:hypothetical protein NQ315_014573 [Exocentrus adspersus]|uniref:Uncharacterized protein n=1 Tax=Exocentrus adspersus TaxID=1586481 RepID=A0AAV8VEC0_9CUCU|nr:hypothetical protein NQ315_014573 [Exocentrus adspersus]